MPKPAVDLPVDARVCVLLVSHDGARWLPGVLDGLAEQVDLVTRVVVVDTGSRDTSRDLLRAAGADVVEAGSGTTYPQAVDLGLERIAATGGEPWVWLLHDDARPAPGALAALLRAAAAHPRVALLGPKLREWPSLRRLLEVGVAISGTGRRETGLERGEYDQGQHDDQHEVLAVNSAGLLARRDVLVALGGFDHRLPMFGNDLDLGWRAAAAGHTTLVVPSAVVFHAEAAHRGVRRTPLTGRHTHYQERRAALYTLLVNSTTAALPWRVVRLTFGTFLRMLGFLLVRSIGEALDDLAALVSVVFRPGQVRAGRRERRERAGDVPPDRRRVARLLPPVWLPYRNGLDAVGDLAAAVTNQAADVAERRREATAAADPSSLAALRLRAERTAEDDDETLADTGAIARFFTSPVALTLTAVVVVLLVGSRVALGQVSGGALSPAPAADDAWWALHYDAWHRIGAGTDVPAPPYVLPLALLGWLVGPGAAVSLVLWLAAPLALWGAWRLLRVTGRLVSPRGAPRWLLVGGATTWAVLPVASGAWGEGRLGLVVATAVLPWLGHAALGFADPEADRRWRAGWRSGLLLTLLTAFAPAGWFVAVALVVGSLAAGALLVRGALAARDAWGPPLVAVGLPAVLLAPWWLPALATGAGAGLVLDTGRTPSATLDAFDLLLGRVGDLGAPLWAGVALAALAVAALVPRATRIPVLICWVVALLAAATGLALSWWSPTLFGEPDPAGVGVAVLVVQGCLVVATALGAQGAVRADLPRPARAVAVALAAAAIVVPAAGLVTTFAGETDLTSTSDEVVPAYMSQDAETGPEHGIVVVRGSVADGLSYDVRRGDGVTLGEDEVLALAGEDDALTGVLDELLSRPEDRTVDALAERGLEYVLLARPADGQVAAVLDATSGLAQVSSTDGSRAWQVTRPLDAEAADGTGGGVTGWVRTVLLVVQGVGLLLALVLAAPTIRAGRTRGRGAAGADGGRGDAEPGRVRRDLAGAGR